VDLSSSRGYAGTPCATISDASADKARCTTTSRRKEDVLTALVVPLMDDIDAFIVDAQAAPRVEREHIER